MRAAAIDQAEGATRGAEQRQILAEEPDRHGAPRGQLGGRSHWKPVPPQQLPHRRASPDAGEGLLLLVGQHADRPSALGGVADPLTTKASRCPTASAMRAQTGASAGARATCCTMLGDNSTSVIVAPSPSRLSRTLSRPTTSQQENRPAEADHPVLAPHASTRPLEIGGRGARRPRGRAFLPSAIEVARETA